MFTSGIRRAAWWRPLFALWIGLSPLASGLWCLAEDHDDVYAVGDLPAAFTSDEAHEHTLVFTGDIMVSDRCADRIARDGVASPFAGVQPILLAADYTIGNLEGPVVDDAEKRSGNFRYKVPSSTLAGLQKAGFDLVSLANNHAMDCGEDGMREMLENLEEAQIPTVGGGLDDEAAEKPCIVTVGEARIAIVAAVCAETWYTDKKDLQEGDPFDENLAKMRRRLGAGDDDPGIVVATPKDLAELVREASKQADLVVVYLHYGIRYEREPTTRQKRLSRTAVDAGADLVVGHHAHIWQPVELYRGVPIVYGLGNLAFGSANNVADEGLLVRAVVEGKSFSRLDFFPLYTRNQDALVDYQPKILAGQSAREVIGDLARLSAPLKATITFHDGLGRMDLPRPAATPAPPAVPQD